VNSKEGMHHKASELGNEATHEDTELPGQRSMNFPYPGDKTADCATKKSNIMEHRANDLHCECMIPCQVTSDLDKEKKIAFLLKELDILRASNKKLQEKLTEEDKEQRKLKVKLELQEKATEAHIAEKTAGTVDERNTYTKMLCLQIFQIKCKLKYEVLEGNRSHFLAIYDTKIYM
uniref:Uncharacterized protein n=1 Tax=Ursus americanus TaxID=9643 RepID=A0A452RX78_URSAM